MRERWRVAVLDSGLAALDDSVVSRRFIDDGSAVHCSAVVPDPIGHGTAVADVICGKSNGARGCDLFVGQVLDNRGTTTAAALAAAVGWAVREGADLIHMSVGLREDRQVLSEAVLAAVAAGCIIVASTPARGAGAYPARYPDVIRATGDARCQWDEISDLHSAQADFGGCPRHAYQPGTPERAHASLRGGASLGAAHLTRFLIEHIPPGMRIAAVRARLGAMARYNGVETH